MDMKWDMVMAYSKGVVMGMGVMQGEDMVTGRVQGKNMVTRREKREQDMVTGKDMATGRRVQVSQQPKRSLPLPNKLTS